jgi:hypothetical protein
LVKRGASNSGHVDDLNPSVRRRIFYRSNQRPYYLVEGDKAESFGAFPRPTSVVISRLPM